MRLFKLKSVLLTRVFTLGSGLSEREKMPSPQVGFWIYSQVVIYMHLYIYIIYVTNPDVAMQKWLCSKPCDSNNWDSLLNSCFPNTWSEIKLKCLLWNSDKWNFSNQRVKKWKIFRERLVKGISNEIREHVIFNLWAWIQTQLLVTKNLLHLGILVALVE